ncbi:Hypothetical_protein [Hexamita inflata]|uniref:Hypothetical_protein n=1 Tax=Hexamita inflata TaxID=28002 RepID=A0AA86NWB1_9EUKA|nr:Hypothetical protein HINF_LOCUS14466 [Hexamita inflata]
MNVNYKQDSSIAVFFQAAAKVLAIPELDSEQELIILQIMLLSAPDYAYFWNQMQKTLNVNRTQLQRFFFGNIVVRGKINSCSTIHCSNDTVVGPRNAFLNQEEE